jgi:hypothetical protein
MVRKESLKSVHYNELRKTMTEAIDRDDGKNSGGLGIESTSGNEKEVMVEFAEPDNAKFVGRNKFLENEETNEDRLTSSFLTHKYGVKPAEGYDLQSSLVTDSFMKGGWIKGSDGGLICTN